MRKAAIFSLSERSVKAMRKPPKSASDARMASAAPGGRRGSARMGRSKLDIELGGATFFDRAAGAARQVFDDVIAVQRPGGGRLGIGTIEEEPHDDSAAIFGVLAALRHAKATCFILAVDYPLINADVLRFLRMRVAHSKSSIVVPRWSGKLQMLCAGYAYDVEPFAAEPIAARRYAVRG